MMIDEPLDEQSTPTPHAAPARPVGDRDRTTLATINCVLGGVQVFAAGFLLCAHLFLSVLNLPFAMNAGLGSDSNAETPFGASAQMAMISAIVQILLAVPMVASGIGLLRCREWAFKLGKTLAIAAGIFALVSLCMLRFVEVVWFGVYSLVALELLARIQHHPDQS